MIYLLHGKDTKSSRIKLKELLSVLKEKREDGAFFKISDQDFNLDKEESIEKIKELISSQGLFGGNYVVVLDSLLSLDKEVTARIESWLEDISSSDHIFIFIDEELKKGTIKKFEGAGSKIQKFEDKDVKRTKKEFNVFKLADALGERNPKKLWLLYRQALAHNIAPEQISGVLFWQIKTMLQVLQNPSSEGIKPFVLNKTKRYLKNWDKKSLNRLSREIIKAHHSQFQGIMESDLALERTILEI